ncbi:hypothetical protein Memar_0443 [Methanoculleus marisnigri JR1]|uniref:Uncharacterized protein n=1 Tax=Methanoculleus marisnigri (strain ATCC 35101 / DSM 1498 / JR1) TaxID=368407 RepID=A3CSM6_METMJ|nr:hypothetical protein Memar_0443 [Methanoculleus marisnigri JR1]
MQQIITFGTIWNERSFETNISNQLISLNGSTMSTRCLLLYSGGIASTACLHHLLSAGFAVTPLYVDPGQSELKNELERIS